MLDYLVRAKNLKKIYKQDFYEVTALNEISFDVKPGEFISVMGHSGAGKTTLLNILGCLDSFNSGKLEIFGASLEDVKEINLEKIRKGNIGFVFQDFYLIPTLTAEENIELPLKFLNIKYDKSKITDVLEQVGLLSRKNHFPRELSGGESQRVAIARAIVANPKILLADEPTGNLDTITASRIFDIFKEINQKGITIIVASHNTKLGNTADRIIKLEDGKIIG